MRPAAVVRGGVLVRDVADARQGGATGERHGFEAGPLGQKVAADARVLRVTRLWDVREVVLQGPGEALGAAHVVAHEAAARCDAWCKGTQGRTLRGEGWQCVARRAQAREREFGGSGVGLGMAEREGFARPSEGEGIDGETPEAVIRALRGDAGVCVELETDG
jgi:hypothetical protein